MIYYDAEFFKFLYGLDFLRRPRQFYGQHLTYDIRSYGVETHGTGAGQKLFNDWLHQVIEDGDVGRGDAGQPPPEDAQD